VVDHKEEIEKVYNVLFLTAFYVGSDYPSRTLNVQEIRNALPGPRTRSRENRGRHNQLAREEPGTKLKAIRKTINNSKQ